MINGLVLSCLLISAERYEIPPLLLQSVYEVERGNKGVVSKNRNGTEDLGWMQINTVWLKELKHTGITKEDLINDPCINFGVAAHILRLRFAKYRNWQDAIASYNAGFKLNNGRRYARKVILKWNKLYAQSYEKKTFTFAMNP